MNGGDRRGDREVKRPPQMPAWEAAQPQEPPENLLIGRNPIREAVKSGRDMEKILVARGDVSGSVKQIISDALARHITVQEVDRKRLDEIAPAHQGIIAFVSAAKYYTLDELFECAAERGEEPFFVVLDGITDPHNLGAIARSAECAGAHGVIIAQRRASGLTPAAVKASAGAFEYIRTARVVNIARTVDELKERGLWIYGASMDAAPYTKADFSGPVALVIGAEGEGISQLVLKKCDHLVSIPLKGQIASLNASCAAAVLLYEVVKARG